MVNVMADVAFQTLYRREYIAEFERGDSSLRPYVTTEANVQGEKAVFLTSNSNREAVTRGSNGLIPAAVGSQTQYECVLSEYHDLPQTTAFDIMRAQADHRRIMQRESRMVINRKIDNLILTELNTGTIDTGSASVMTKRLATKALVTLWNANVPNDGNITVLLTPAAWGYMSEVPEFANADYVNDKPNVDGPRPKYWMNAYWMLHTGLTGVGTSAAKCIAFHRSAIGHAYNKEIDARVGYDEEQDYYWTRTSVYMGAKLLQNAGVVIINHDDSGLIGS